MRIIVGIALVLSVVGCGSSRVYLNRDVQTVLVLIPFNESQGENEAPLKMWPYVEEQVARRGYRLVPREKVSAFYDAKKYTDPAQIGEWSHDELCKEFKVDAIVISHLVAWDKKTLGVYNSIEVKLLAELRARDGSKEGALVWNGEGEDGYSATAGGKGILQGLVGVAATDPVKYAPGAAARCFGGLPYAGWDPEVKKP
jgi:hypothetical protein